MLQKLNQDFLNYRREKNILGSNLLSTLKGAFELERSKPSNRGVTDDKLINSCAKTISKGLVLTDTTESLKELVMLKDFMPATLDMSDSDMIALLEPLMLETLGNFGLKMKAAMTVLGGKVDGKRLSNFIKEYY